MLLNKEYGKRIKNNIQSKSIYNISIQFNLYGSKIFILIAAISVCKLWLILMQLFTI